MGNMKLINRCFRISILCLMGITLNVNAQSFMPSPQQIQQFKNLPRAQQEQLAKQMGFDISILDQVNGQGREQKRVDEVDFIERELDGEEISKALSKQSVIEEDSTKLVPFGYDVFESRDDAVQPSSHMPVPPNYIIGPGDSIKLQLFGKESGDFELFVTNEGNIDLPDLGPLQVAGNSFQELKALVKDKFEQQKIGVTSFVSMGQVRTIQIFLVGEVYRPGPLVVSGMSTITTALINSGGISEIGSLRNIELKRNGVTVANFDLYDLIVKGDTRNDIRLQQGDVLFVPTVKNVVSLEGEVRRPAIYELKPSETISDLLTIAGGLLPAANSNSLQLVRKNPTVGLSIINVDVHDMAALNVELSNGDFLRVPKANLEFGNAIIINGAINTPNIIADTGLSISDLITLKTLYSNTDLDYALVIRKERLEERSTVIQFKPNDVLAQRYDLKLQAFDEVLIFSRVSENAKPKNGGFLVGNIKVSSDDIKNREAKYLQDIEVNKFTPEGFSRESSKTFSRNSLLSATIARLKSEASDSHPVQLLEVSGEVKYPGIYPLPSETSLRKVLDAAGGLTESAYLQNAEISSFRLSEGVMDVEHKRINIYKQLLLAEENQVKLQSKDVLSIVKIPQWNDSNKVELRGEFVFPGVYQIKDGEMLSSVIKRAGGLTDKASAEASVFSREELKTKERNNIDKAIEDLRQQLANNNLSSSQFTKIIDYQNANLVLDDLTKVEPLGRMIIDLTSIVDGKSNNDVAVKNGDLLVVPNITPAVSIIGEVYVTATHRYDESLSIDDYISLAGGVREFGDSSNIYIVKANGSVIIPESSFWFSEQDENTLSPGDTIVVPRDVTNYENITLWQGVTQILYQSAIAIAAVKSL